MHTGHGGHDFYLEGALTSIIMILMPNNYNILLGQHDFTLNGHYSIIRGKVIKGSVLFVYRNNFSQKPGCLLSTFLAAVPQVINRQV